MVDIKISTFLLQSSIHNSKNVPENSSRTVQPFKIGITQGKMIRNVCDWENLWKAFSPNPLLMYSANVKDSENADRWLAAVSFFIVH